MNTTQLKEFAQLAQAAYAYFDLADFAGNGGNDGALKREITNKDTGAFSEREATDFSSRFILLHQFRETSVSNGFSASLFQDKQSGQLVFSIRGTEIPLDITRDLFVTDLRIGIDGYASPQVLSLYRYFKQLNTVGGVAVSYTAREIANLEAVYVDQFPDTDFRRADWAKYKASLLADIGVDAGQGAGKALIPADQTVDVAGHSLGGHLALLMDRLFPARIHQIVTLNAPGFYPQGTSVLNGFSAGWNEGRILRMEAAGDGVSEIGSTFPGTRILVGQENAPGPVAALSSNHSSVNGADGLAVAELFGKFDPRMAADARLFKPMLDAASSQPTTSYESVLDALRKLLLGSGVAPTTPNSGTSPSSRASLYDNMDALVKGAAFTSLADKVRIDLSTADLRAKARNDFSALASLITLSPVVLTGLDASLDGVLRGVWGSTYTDWQTDKSMSQADRDAGKETFTGKYIDDRALMLDTLVRANQNDEVFYTDRAAKDVWVYEDTTSNTLIVRQPGGPSAFPRHYVTFGDQGANTLNGEAKEDHLYGGTGDDILNGQGGDDYLEGNAGADRLFGGADNDTILGGAGDDSALEGEAGFDSLLGGAGSDNLYGGADGDTLYGGAGNDLLDGGTGNDFLHGGDGLDLYDFAAGWGADIIEDSDGRGSIQVAGFGTLTGEGAIKLSPNTWKSADGKVLFTVDPTSHQLAIRFVGVSDSILVNGWTNGLGIDLGGSVQAPATTSTYVGDFNKLIDVAHNAYTIIANNYVSAGNVPVADDVMTGSAGADNMQGLRGNDALSGEAGDDFIDGGQGDDFLMGGFGRDTLNGGSGQDFIFGSGAGSLVLLGSPIEPGPVADGPELTRGFSWVWFDSGIDGYGFPTYAGRGGNYSTLGGDDGNVIDAGAGNDYIAAGSGDDVVYGGADDDIVAGQYGADTLFGDGGNDNMEGDGPDLMAYVTSVEGALQANDILFGGAGNDSLAGDGGDDQLYGGDDNDTLYGDGGANAKVTPFIYDGRDYLDGGAGNDELSGEGSDDELFGGTGNDKLWGDASLDRLDGKYHGNDYLDGEENDDYLEGGGGADTLFGGAGNDNMWGDASQNGLKSAEYGADYLDGEAGADTMSGGGKGDTLYGGADNDVMFGDGELTEVAAVDQGADYLDGEGGNDWLRGDGKGDTLVGGDGDDYLVGDGPQVVAAEEGADYLYGGAGNDGLLGGTGNDWLDGGSGDDLLMGGSGADTLIGGDGNDFAFGSGVGSFTHGPANLVGRPVDLPVYQPIADGTEITRGFSWVTYLKSADANGFQTAWMRGVDSQNTYFDTYNDDPEIGNSIDGGKGDDWLYGGVSDDTVYGGGDDDHKDKFFSATPATIWPRCRSLRQPSSVAIFLPHTAANAASDRRVA